MNGGGGGRISVDIADTPCKLLPSELPQVKKLRSSAATVITLPRFCCCGGDGDGDGGLADSIGANLPLLLLLLLLFIVLAFKPPLVVFVSVNTPEEDVTGAKPRMELPALAAPAVDEAAAAAGCKRARWRSTAAIGTSSSNVRGALFSDTTVLSTARDSSTTSGMQGSPSV